ncbi:transmembrane protein 258 [Pyrus ussuriensis x Pyrus communis]|uniref:Dolichyl-diphosphooligosaccharide-protein glycosyltransferase subunit OST5 n=1 Tax=Pyrus ussuriensis x Pyrus communis TaxID=2448454 RepID=A0A5N5GWT4_9ROSA|nr:transmembrane protein 258 [Pyrus ussuriensis x Pyrus communis]
MGNDCCRTPRGCPPRSIRLREHSRTLSLAPSLCTLCFDLNRSRTEAFENFQFAGFDGKPKALQKHFSLPSCFSAPKAITSPVPITWYPTLAVVMVSLGLLFTASFFIYAATISRKNRSLAKEITTGTLASFFLGFGTLYVLLASGVYV